MNQANVGKLVSKLNYNLKPRRRLRNSEGPKGRIAKLQKTLTALFKFERIELNYHRADETRGYAERLISEALKYGPHHNETMELANYWILEKQLVHKLFKVFVPRYQDYVYNYTKMHRAPLPYPGWYRARAVLELRGNIYPKLEQTNNFTPNLLHNILLNEARKDFRMQKYKELAESMNKDTQDKETQEG